MTDEANTQDPAAMPPASAGSAADRVPFSRRAEMSRQAVAWCDKAGAPAIPLNIVTAFSALGFLTPTLTGAEREAIENVVWSCGSATHKEWQSIAAVLRGLLEREKFLRKPPIS